MGNQKVYHLKNGAIGNIEETGGPMEMRPQIVTQQIDSNYSGETVFLMK